VPARTIEAAPTMAIKEAQALLGKAILNGCQPAAQRAVQAGADPDEGVFDANGNPGGTRTAVLMATRVNCVAMLQFLVRDVGADPNKGNISDGYTPLHCACAWNNHESVPILLEAGADPSLVFTDAMGGRTPCMLAAYIGKVACLRALHDRSPGGVLASVNAVGTGGYYDGKTALDVAKEQNNGEAVVYLRTLLSGFQ